MPEIIFPGPEGRLHGRFHPQKSSDAPIAIILHPHPQYGGSMNNKVVYNLHYTFFNLGFSCLRFNFRGIGRSQGQFDHGVGELSDAASALDYLQLHVPNARSCWVAGFSFGAWIAMQLLMRRPEVKGFVAVSPPAKTYDFNFLAPCPSSGMLINGKNDKVVNPDDVSANPKITVPIIATELQPTIIRRAPNRSSIIPKGICTNAEERNITPMTTPISAGVN